MHVACQIRVGFLPGVRWVTRSGRGGLGGQGRQRPDGSGGNLSGVAGAVNRLPVSDVLDDV